MAVFGACSDDESTTSATGGTGATATGGTGGTNQGGTTAQGGQAQGGQAQGGQAQGGQAQGGQAQGGQAQGGQGQGGFVSGASCEALCTAAQVGQCTAIVGDCATFCDALLSVAPAADCVSESESYIDCLGDPATVCDANCNQQNNSLRTCVTTYCAAHQSDQDCIDLAAAYGIG
jgi:hypothetical protein